MPNIITHKIFAEEVLKKISKKDIEDIIERYHQIYYSFNMRNHGKQ